MSNQALLFALRRQATRGTRRSLSMVDALDAAKFLAWETEFVFAPPRRWRFDFAWPAFRIALEVEGGVFGRMLTIESGHETRAGQRVEIAHGTRVRAGGRHNDGRGMEKDLEKYNHAAICGWAVLRVTTRMIRDGEAIAVLRAAFAARGLE